ncbi:hypothetical protein GBA63_18550 [Rubrobacter tropicus]|uniref:Uncharacterized protein n=1 Tax=Rubrobacter tropicus TaxID=2653851 RepID=A0A6G8QDU0_9ACTN|nr:hypothetical protein [Rubrobacter tropicus]QIN84417.1 hypothetical protein GBA63_18550 [Rubrobacter tropicus]
MNPHGNRLWSLGTVFAAALVLAALMLAALAVLSPRPAAAHSGDRDHVHSPSYRDRFDVMKAANETGTGLVSVTTAIEDSDRPTVHDATIEFGTAESYPAASSYRCRIDGGSWKVCTSPVTYRGLALEVEHTFEVKGTSRGITGSPVASTWTTVNETAPEQGLGLVIPEVFYGLQLDEVFGHVFGNEYAGLSGHDHQGSPAYSRFSVGGSRDVSFLYAGSEPDSVIEVCNRTPDNASAKGTAWNNQTANWHVAIARNDGNCNATYTNANHESHWTTNALVGSGGESFH